MSAMPQAKRPPYFTTYAECEVDVDPSELERAGWVYVGKDKDDAPTTESVLDTVIRWHDDNHDGPWRWCSHDLCDSLRRRESGR